VDVSKAETLRGIEQIYRELTKQHYLDRVEPEGVVDFQELVNAYEFLSAPERRHAYNHNWIADRSADSALYEPWMTRYFADVRWLPLLNRRHKQALWRWMIQARQRACRVRRITPVALSTLIRRSNQVNLGEIPLKRVAQQAGEDVFLVRAQPDLLSEVIEALQMYLNS